MARVLSSDPETPEALPRLVDGMVVVRTSHRTCIRLDYNAVKRKRLTLV